MAEDGDDLDSRVTPRRRHPRPEPVTGQRNPSPADAARPPHPPGRAAERTLLAWVRTGLAYCACAAVLARAVQPRHVRAAAAIVLLSVAAGAVLTGRAASRYRAGAPPLAPAPVLALTAAAIALGGVALLALLAG